MKPLGDGALLSAEASARLKLVQSLNRDAVIAAIVAKMQRTNPWHPVQKRHSVKS